MAISLKKWCKYSLSAVAFASTLAFASYGAYAQLIKAAGASFPEILFERYSTAYEEETGAEFEYKVIGSGGGIRKFVEESINIGSTTLVPTPIERNQVEDGMLMIPTAGGAVAVVYNLQDVTTDVRLSREKLAQIFTGEISNWRQVNPRLPNREIQVVVRSDDSGTTFILTKYLRQITNGKVAARRNSNWDFDIFAERPQDSGVAAEVRRIDGAIGYVQASYALQNNLPVARLQNLAGNYVNPTVEETKKALGELEFNEDLTTTQISDPATGYPLVGLTWLLIYKNYPNQDLLDSTQDFITWVLTRGQEFNEELNYTKIPEDVAERALETINNELEVR